MNGSLRNQKVIILITVDIQKISTGNIPTSLTKDTGQRTHIRDILPQYKTVYYKDVDNSFRPPKVNKVIILHNLITKILQFGWKIRSLYTMAQHLILRYTTTLTKRPRQNVYKRYISIFNKPPLK